MNVLARMFSLDLRSIALFRIGIAVALLCDVVTRAIDVRAFLTDDGMFPRALWFRIAQPGGSMQDLWSFHVATGSVAGALALLAISGALALALLLGWRARTAAIASLVLLVSLHNRNMQVFYGFDLLLRVSLLWLCFLPLSERWSLDAHLNPDRKDDDTACPDGAQYVSAGTVALTLQMIIVYAFSGIQKLQDQSWHTLDAVWLGLTTDHHATSIARWLAGAYEVTRAMSVAVLALELLVPWLLLVPLRDKLRDGTRLFVVASFMLFHVGTAVLFELGLFPLIGIVAWLPFLPARVWDRAAASTRTVTWAKRRGVAAAVGALLVVILASNVESVTRPFLPRVLKRAVFVLRLDQNWNMFERPMADGWFIARATRENGTTLDVLRGGALVTLEKPPHLADTFTSMRWRKYVTGLVRTAGQRHRAPFLYTLCNQWKRETGERLVSVELVMMQETEFPKSKSPAITTMRSLAAVRCR
jgi:hypothetical protein